MSDRNANPAASTVAFFGLGAMGAPMTLNLVRAGYQVKGYSRRGASADLVAAGVIAATDPFAAIEGADIVITNLPDGHAVADLMLGSARLADQLVRESLFIDMSSIEPGVARTLHAELAERGIGALDAPVSGGVRGALEASLSIFVGGNKGDFERARHLLESLGDRITYLGGAGAGQTAKLVNQVIVALTIGAVAEGLALARAAGLDLGGLREALSGGFASSRILDEHGLRMVERNYAPGARMVLHAKDLDAALKVAAATGVTLPATAASREQMAMLIDRGLGDLDHSALFEALGGGLPAVAVP